MNANVICTPLSIFFEILVCRQAYVPAMVVNGNIHRIISIVNTFPTPMPNFILLYWIETNNADIYILFVTLHILACENFIKRALYMNASMDDLHNLFRTLKCWIVYYTRCYKRQKLIRLGTWRCEILSNRILNKVLVASLGR